MLSRFLYQFCATSKKSLIQSVIVTAESKQTDSIAGKIPSGAWVFNKDLHITFAQLRFKYFITCI